MELLSEDATFIKNIQKLACECPSRPAYIFVDKDLNQRVISRQEIWDISRKFAAVLKHLGLGKGDIVCNTLVNSPERLFTCFGTMVSGAIPSQGQLFRADGQDLIRNLKESKSKAIIYDPCNTKGVKHILEKIKFVDQNTGATRYKDLPDLTHVIEIKAKGLEEAERWMHVINKEEDMFVDESIVKDDTAMIFVTSGTTGFSKLVPHSHATLIKVMSQYKRILGMDETTVVYNMQLLGWIAGCVSYYTAIGCKRVLIDETNGHPKNMDRGAFLVHIFNKTNVNICVLMARDIQHVLEAYNNGLRVERKFDFLHTGGSPIHNPTIESLCKITQSMLIVYGGTDFVLVSVNFISNKSDFQDMCVGYPVDCEVKIVGEDDKEVPEGKQGEVLVRSDSVFKVYLNNPRKTASVFTEDGFCRTGDIGYFNKKGQLFVLGRKADAIINDGVVHYPDWMEQLINKHPKIEKAVVIGIPNPVHHEEICLCIKLVSGAEVSNDDMREYCKDLFLTCENDRLTPLPKYYLLFDDFGTNANGKVERKKIREEVLNRLKIDSWGLS